MGFSGILQKINALDGLKLNSISVAAQIRCNVYEVAYANDFSLLLLSFLCFFCHPWCSLVPSTVAHKNLGPIGAMLLTVP